MKVNEMKRTAAFILALCIALMLSCAAFAGAGVLCTGWRGSFGNGRIAGLMINEEPFSDTDQKNFAPGERITVTVENAEGWINYAVTLRYDNKNHQGCALTQDQNGLMQGQIVVPDTEEFLLVIISKEAAGGSDTPSAGCVHELEYAAGFPASCENDGQAEHYVCRLCGRMFSDAQGQNEIESAVIPALGHDWGEWQTVRPATETASGERRRVCKNDPSHVQTEIIPASGSSAHDCPSAKYEDVDQRLWYHAAVDYAVSNGIMYGVTDTTFDPDGELSRAMLVAVLYRLEGRPETDAGNVFSDVADGFWYTKGIVWASENGIVFGYGDGRFGPDDPVTREQMAAIMMRYAAYKGYPTDKRADISDYSDSDEVSFWAVKAVSWARAEGIMTGRSGDTLAPLDGITRAECASLIMRFIKNHE